MLVFDKCAKPDTGFTGVCAADVSDASDLYRFNEKSYTLLPGFCDVHVHFREPGFSYKETIATGCRAAAAGGFTAVCTMPNLEPVPDCPEHLRLETDLIRKDAAIGVYPYGAITVGERGETLADMAGMASDVIAFSDDGKGLQNDDMMLRAMMEAKQLGKIIAAHCEVNELLRGGYIHEGAYAASHGHRGICSESEWRQIDRDLKLAEKTGCAYHVCHISTKESAALIRDAKRSGVDVTCETAPHYLILDEHDLQEDGRFKMNPPLRTLADREALIEGILDGTIDMIATDHAPHAEEEKSKGLDGSAFGIVGLETAFPLLYTYFIQSGIISMEKLIDLMVRHPRKRFGIPLGNDFSVWDLNESFRITPDSFHTKGKATPFTGLKVFGACCMAVFGGSVGFQRN